MSIKFKITLCDKPEIVLPVETIAYEAARQFNKDEWDKFMIELTRTMKTVHPNWKP